LQVQLLSTYSIQLHVCVATQLAAVSSWHKRFVKVILSATTFNNLEVLAEVVSQFNSCCGVVAKRADALLMIQPLEFLLRCEDVVKPLVDGIGI
jgi:hypothetical protein